jgi:hypothetical protein
MFYYVQHVVERYEHVYVCQVLVAVNIPTYYSSLNRTQGFNRFVFSVSKMDGQVRNKTLQGPWSKPLVVHSVVTSTTNALYISIRGRVGIYKIYLYVGCLQPTEDGSAHILVIGTNGLRLQAAL